MIKKTKEGKCPFCGSLNLNYYDEEYCDNSMAYKIKCEDCGKFFIEYYKTVYDGFSYYDEDENFHDFNENGEEV